MGGNGSSSGLGTGGAGLSNEEKARIVEAAMNIGSTARQPAEAKEPALVGEKTKKSEASKPEKTKKSEASTVEGKALELRLKELRSQGRTITPKELDDLTKRIKSTNEEFKRFGITLSDKDLFEASRRGWLAGKRYEELWKMLRAAKDKKIATYSDKKIENALEKANANGNQSILRWKREGSSIVAYVRDPENFKNSAWNRMIKSLTKMGFQDVMLARYDKRDWR